MVLNEYRTGTGCHHMQKTIRTSDPHDNEDVVN